MHAVIRTLASVGTGALLYSISIPAMAAPRGDADAWCNLYGGTCEVSVNGPANPGRHTSASGGNGSGKSAVASVARPDPNPCSYLLYVPQPPKSDPIWGGHTTGAIYSYTCEQSQDFVAVLWRGTPPTGPGAPTVTPAELAQQARALLRLPEPVLHRSPIEANSDSGLPYTWVRVWTWFWTSPATWQERSKTASVGGVSATVTATPTELTFDPGDGRAPVSCPGPGRPWTAADGMRAPSEGGCGYRYRHVSNGLRARVSIRWVVTWAGSDGSGGPLPPLATQATSPMFKVEQIQVVNR